MQQPSNDSPPSPADRRDPAGIDRVLPLQGGRNFRDLGGYATHDGRRTRWRMLFRSGTLGRLTADDIGQLERLGLRVVCDLRATDERAAEPTRWTSGPRVLAFDYLNETRPFMSALRSMASAGAPRMREAMLSLYRGYPESFAPRYRDLFGELLEGNVPLAFHCTAGKDRTGIAAALILSALGVPRATVVEDYVLSDALLQGQDIPVPANLGGASGADASGAGSDGGLLALVARLPPQIRGPLLAADRDYLLAALEAIDQAYGSLESYLERRLGLGQAALGRLRERFLED